MKNAGDITNSNLGEHPEDFDECQCGGKLQYKEEIGPKAPDYKRLLKGLPLIILFFIIVPYLLIRYLPSDIPQLYIIGGFVFIVFIIGIITGQVKLGPPKNRNL
ncbi:MAG: hypothetical protein QMD61_07795 [Methanobacterium sp.]|nr:hypothetical protein [Methanobacterium sp.]